MGTFFILQQDTDKADTRFCAKKNLLY